MVEPRNFYAPEDIYREVSEQLQTAHSSGEPVDHLTFVPDGEPTLDINLGRAIDLLRPYNIPIAVISNASLLWHKAVRAAIGKAYWVSVKVDSVVDPIWKQVNRPHEALRLDDIMDGIRQFARHFHGKLVAETMLIHGINDNEHSVASVAGFLKKWTIWAIAILSDVSLHSVTSNRTREQVGKPSIVQGITSRRRCGHLPVFRPCSAFCRRGSTIMAE